MGNPLGENGAQPTPLDNMLKFKSAHKHEFVAAHFLQRTMNRDVAVSGRLGKYFAGHWIYMAPRFKLLKLVKADDEQMRVLIEHQANPSHLGKTGRLQHGASD